MNTDISKLYLQLGFEHILPLGLDHILFIISLFLLNPKLKPVLLQATVFTLSHSISLGFAAAGLIKVSSSIIEPLIALSIVYVAIENIFVQKVKPTRLILIFLFGLMHGLGFAGVLSSLGMPEGEFFTALLCFNLGVEGGQITVILIAWLLLGTWMSRQSWYHSYAVIPLSAIIALSALYWTIERIFFLS